MRRDIPSIMDPDEGNGSWIDNDDDARISLKDKFCVKVSVSWIRPRAAPKKLPQKLLAACCPVPRHRSVSRLQMPYL
jgi:hypothetical protein